METNLEQVVAFNSGGHENPIIMIPPVGGQVHWYREMAKSFGKCTPIFALISLGLLADDFPFLSVEEAARVGVENILRKPIRGPFTLIGWSYGCELAFQISKQLLNQGQEVSLLVLLDPQVMRPGHFDVAKCLLEVFKKEYNLDISEMEQVASFSDLALDSGKKFVGELVKYIVDLDETKRPHEKYYNRAIKVYLNNVINMRQYQKSGKVPRILLMPAEDSSKVLSFLRQASLEDWKNYADEILELTLPGDHYTILTGDPVSQIVREVNSILLQEAIKS